ncbi:hypothetical protein IL306_003806 [Fusarium sp. DS 682]|nr:hypothetical protein IL306_003806 [Fusarium sp. DS 682]
MTGRKPGQPPGSGLGQRKPKKISLPTKAPARHYAAYRVARNRIIKTTKGKDVDKNGKEPDKEKLLEEALKVLDKRFEEGRHPDQWPARSQEIDATHFDRAFGQDVIFDTEDNNSDEWEDITDLTDIDVKELERFNTTNNYNVDGITKTLSGLNIPKKNCYIKYLGESLKRAQKAVRLIEYWKENRRENSNGLSYLPGPESIWNERSIKRLNQIDKLLPHDASLAALFRILAGGFRTKELQKFKVVPWKKRWVLEILKMDS